MSSQTLIDAQHLHDLAHTHDALIVDCRFALSDPDGATRDYAQGHIRGAVYADLNRDLSDLSKQGLGRHPLPDASAFSAVLGRWGWKPGMQVVGYDAANGAIAAARLWWMLRLIGERNVAVLDGGVKAWTDAGFALSAEFAPRRVTSVDVQFASDQIVDSTQLQRALQKPEILLIDARAAERFRGDIEPLDPVAGHVPGARNRPFCDNLDPEGRFKPAEQLREEFEALLAGHDAVNTVHMCGSGVTACHNLLAMEYAGMSGSRIYAPSWSGWISESTRQVALG